MTLIKEKNWNMKEKSETWAITGEKKTWMNKRKYILLYPNGRDMILKKWTWLNKQTWNEAKKKTTRREEVKLP